MGGIDPNSLAKKDEAAYIKALKEREEKESIKDQEKNRSIEQSKSSNINGLSYQIKEKEMQKKMNSLQEAHFGNDMRQRVIIEDSQEKMKQEAAKQRMIEN